MLSSSWLRSKFLTNTVRSSPSRPPVAGPALRGPPVPGVLPSFGRDSSTLTSRSWRYCPESATAFFAAAAVSKSTNA